MARTSTIRRLPAAVRQYIAQSREGGATIEELVAAVEAEFGATVSRSAMGRHVKELDAVAQRMRESREMAEGLVRELGDIADNRQGELLVQMLHTMIFKQFRDRIAEDGGADFEPREFMALARALRDVSTASAVDAKKAMEIERHARERAARAVDKEARKRGLDADTRKAFFDIAVGKA